MDEFGVDRPELTGSLISMEFGPGGRIHQLWATNPGLPDDADEFQFVLSPLNFGEEIAEDYYPGTVLIGARTNPDDPWAVSRNSHAEVLESGEGSNTVVFEYELPLLEEVRARGRYFEVSGVIPEIVWEVDIKNQGRRSIEIGELGFPMAFHNHSEGSEPRREDRDSISTRVQIHKFIGGAASYLYCQRSSREAPGLLVYPGENSAWEFWCSVPASLQTPFRWQGIPVVYALSRAAVEREGWGGWFNEHTSLILEPGDSRKFEIRFVPTAAEPADIHLQTLAALQRPAIRVLPSAVAPREVGIAVEINGSQPTRFILSKEAEVETDAEEDGGFCFVRPKLSGANRLSFEDSQNRLSHAHLFFLDPIADLIKLRADWITSHQFNDDATGALNKAILMTNIRTGERLNDPDYYSDSFAISAGLSDALYLAEKNSIYPDPSQIKVLDELIVEFLQDDLQNPADGSVGSGFADFQSVALNFGVPHLYPVVFNLYNSMYRVAKHWEGTHFPPKRYLRDAYRTAMAMFVKALPRDEITAGWQGFARIHDLVEDLRSEGLVEEAATLNDCVEQRARTLMEFVRTAAMEALHDPSRFEELFWAANLVENFSLRDKLLKRAFSTRSLAPSWWSYGTEPRSWDDHGGPPPLGIHDRGDVMLGSMTPALSLLFFESLTRDYELIPEAEMRLAFGGMMAPWALVRDDGSASMGFCPDLASKQRGHLPFTGDVGLALFHYLRGASSFVLPNRMFGVFSFGCHFEVDDKGYHIRPWDGIGRRIVLRQIDLSVNVQFGCIRSVDLDTRKRWIKIEVENPSDREVKTELEIYGLWGNQFESGGRFVQGIEGQLTLPIVLPKSGILSVEAKVVS